MRAWALPTFLACGIVSAPGDSALGPESRFNSPGEFISRLEAFEPAKTDTYFGFLFTTKELGQPEDAQTGAMIRAEKIDLCSKVVANDQDALIFATASPPTQATHSSVALLFILSKAGNQWRIADFHKFTAEGKYASIDINGTGDGYAAPLAVTVTEHEGGRGAAQDRVRSYTVSDDQLVPDEMR